LVSTSEFFVIFTGITMSSTKRRRRALEKELPGENSPNPVDEQAVIEGQDAGEDDGGFYNDVNEPLSIPCVESDETPSDLGTTVPGKDLVEP
jgi:hypothetical protein